MITTTAHLLRNTANFSKLGELAAAAGATRRLLTDKEHYKDVDSLFRMVGVMLLAPACYHQTTAVQFDTWEKGV